MIRSNLLLLAELVVLFVGIAMAVQIVQRRLGAERVRAWMGGRPAVAALKGIAIGFVTPFCTFSAIPMLIGLRRAGVPTAGYVAFIVAAPVLDPVMFGALAVIAGFEVAFVYVTVAFAAAMTLALFAERIDVDRWLRNTDVLGAPGDMSCDGTADTPPWDGWGAEISSAWRAAGRLFRKLGPILIIGVAVGAAIEALVTPDDVDRITGGNASTSIPIAAIAGIPMYFSTELFVPIADSLRAAGVGVGAIVALTIAGTGANLPEFAILSRITTPRVLSVFGGYVLGVALVGGTLAQLLS